MKLLFDENLSPKLATGLASQYPGSAHVRDIDLRGAEDRRIWEENPNALSVFGRLKTSHCSPCRSGQARSAGRRGGITLG